MTQINPPFDGSTPCAACQDELRGLSAYMHNFLNRCTMNQEAGTGSIREGKAWSKLWDLRGCRLPDTLTVPSPEGEEILACALALLEATDGMLLDGQTIRAGPEIRARVEALIPRVAKACDAWEPITDAHFHDRRHSHSGDSVNVLRESRGSSWNGHWTKKGDTSYEYTIARVALLDADLVHGPCGSGFKLHQHFLADLRRDRTFFGRVYCPTCRMDVPIGQFSGWALTDSPVGS